MVLTLDPPTNDPLRPFESARLTIARLSVHDDQPLPGVFRRVCEIAADTLDVERVGIWLMTNDGKALRCANLYQRSRGGHSEGVTFQIADFPEYFRSVGGRRALATEMVQSDPRTAELRDAYLVPLGITSLLNAPLLRNGEMVGMVCHEHVGPPREWTTEDRDFAMSVADLVAAKIKAAELNLARTALRHQAEHLAEADRLETVGRLAAGVAHDFKNLLTVVMGNAGLIARKPGLPADVVHKARQIIDAAERGSSLVRELLDFGREPSGAPRVLSVPDVAGAFVPMLQAAVGPDCPLAFTRDGAAGKVLIDRANLERVLLNLVLNARDATPVGGPIRVHVTTEVTAEDEEPPGMFVRIDVTDSGTGISDADRAHIFDPFFTTKPPGKGNGLGLAVVRRVVERTGGFVRVESTPGRGTTFRLFLPRVTGEG
ncbi:MAG TPA: ATP-binding protein [Gemmataceae bacterium]|nr:ATP-binding protein [Gemmataceae bacterium]